jgi:hypothetical protein
VIYSTLPEFTGIAIIIAFFVLFFAWSGNLFFPTSTEEGREYFPDIFEVNYTL